MRSKVKPAKKTIPEEFSPNHKITAPDYTFVQPVPRTLNAPLNNETPNVSYEDDQTQTGEVNERSLEQEDQAENKEEEINQKEVASKPISTHGSSRVNKEQAQENESVHNTAKSSGRSNKSERVQKHSILEDEECIELKNRTIESHDFSDLEEDQLQILLLYLKEYILYEGAEGNYEEAKRAKSLQAATVDTLYHKQHDYVPSEEAKRRFEARKRRQEEKWQKEIDNYDLDTQEKINELTERHNKELSDLDQKWTSEHQLRKYQKASSRLIQLRKMEKFLAKQTKFEDAELVHAEAEELEKREYQSAQAIASRDYHKEQDKVLEKQKNEMDALLETREHWRDILLSRQKTEKDVYNNTDQKVKTRLKEPPRVREAQLPSKTKTRSAGTSSRHNTLIASGADISFKYNTVLPKLNPPIDKRSTSRSLNSDSKSQTENSSRPESHVSTQHNSTRKE